MLNALIMDQTMATAVQRDGPRRMSIEEFLAWDSGDDLRYELVKGWPVAQSAPSTSHARITANLSMAIGSRLRAALRARIRWRCAAHRQTLDSPGP